MATPTLTGRLAAVLAIAFATAAFAPASRADIRSMIVTSDPQYPWTPASDEDEPESEADRDERSRALIEEQYRSIVAYRAARPGEDIPVFINGNDVAAVFAGHLHGELGYDGTLGGVPVFLSGSASHRTYLIVEHDTGKAELAVYGVTENDPEQKRLLHRVKIPRGQ